MQNKMHRWSNEHPLPVHIPDGYMDRFVLLSSVRPPVAKSSSGVSVESFQIGDDWALEFRLNSSRFESAFSSLYEDLYNSTWNTDPRNAASVFIDIYNRWKQAFSSKSKPLSEREIQGIIGEMIAIRDLLMDRMAPRDVLESWMIAGFGKQDFVTSDGWFEVKSIMDCSQSIRISSIEQLDEGRVGTLIVVKLRKTSLEDKEGITVNTLIDELYESFSDSGCGEDFMRLVGSMDLPCSDYDEYCYRLCGLDVYRVGPDFPCIRRTSIPDAVEKVEYDLSLRALNKFKVM